MIANDELIDDNYLKTKQNYFMGQLQPINLVQLWIVPTHLLNEFDQLITHLTLKV